MISSRNARAWREEKASLDFISRTVKTAESSSLRVCSLDGKIDYRLCSLCAQQACYCKHSCVLGPNSRDAASKPPRPDEILERAERAPIYLCCRASRLPSSTGYGTGTGHAYMPYSSTSQTAHRTQQGMLPIHRDILSTGCLGISTILPARDVMPICASVGNGRAILFPSRPDCLYTFDSYPPSFLYHKNIALRIVYHYRVTQHPVQGKPPITALRRSFLQTGIRICRRTPV